MTTGLKLAVLSLSLFGAFLVHASVAPEPVRKPDRSGSRCVERKLDVRTGNMITRYGCEKPRQGRWRDVGRALSAQPAP